MHVSVLVLMGCSAGRVPEGEDTAPIVVDTAPDSGDDTGGADVRTPPFSKVQTLLDASCTECHSGAHIEAGLDLSDPYTALVEVRATQVATMTLVAPGSTFDSSLWYKLRGTQSLVGGSGD